MWWDFLNDLFGKTEPQKMDVAIIDMIRGTLDKNGFVFFDSGIYNLNLIGLRKLPKKDWNAFDDSLLCVYKDDYEAWRIKSYSITTMPGTSVLQQPINAKGTAILKAGQWRGFWEIGLHKGEYEALRQKGPGRVLRYQNGKIVMEDDAVGINCHKAGEHSTQVDGWSAGCQVFQMKEEFESFMHICTQQRDLRGFESFTYTLLEI